MPDHAPSFELARNTFQLLPRIRIAYNSSRAGSSPATRYRTQHNRTQEGLPRGTACTSDTTSGLYAQRALDTGSLARRPADENKPGAKTAGLALVLAYDTDDAFNRLNRILGVVVVL